MDSLWRTSLEPRIVYLKAPARLVNLLLKLMAEPILSRGLLRRENGFIVPPPDGDGVYTVCKLA
jgi:hypothetical protein